MADKMRAKKEAEADAKMKEGDKQYASRWCLHKRSRTNLFILLILVLRADFLRKQTGIALLVLTKVQVNKDK